MKCISLWQPWASLVAIGAKRIETRSWSTSYRGPLAIHAAKKWTAALRDLCWTPTFRAALSDPRETVNCGGLLPRGAIVAVTKVIHCGPIHESNDGRFHVLIGNDWVAVDVQEQEFGDYQEGRYAWLLGDTIKLNDPVPFSGHQGFFDVPDALLRQPVISQ